MNINLTLFDRISIPTMFPEKASFADGIVYDDIRQKIKITQDEVSEYKVRSTTDGSGVEWDNEPKEGKKFELTTLEERVIIKALKELDAKSQVPTDPKFIALFKKFIN